MLGGRGGYGSGLGGYGEAVSKIEKLESQTMRSIKRLKKLLIAKASRASAIFAVRHESSQHTPAIAPPASVGHSKWADHLSSQFNKPGIKVLEIGSRVVTGANFRGLFDKAEYTGFDIYPGENVDVAGDAHRLSKYFKDEEFDLIFSSAVFEHLAMPWIVAEEISKILKVGGRAFVETHFSFSSHERPWNFFQFSDMGLKALFNPSLGFNVIEAGMSNPIQGWFGSQADEYLRYREVGELYCHSEILCEKVAKFNGVDWREVDIDTLTGSTHYPKPSANK